MSISHMIRFILTVHIIKLNNKYEVLEKINILGFAEKSKGMAAGFILTTQSNISLI